MSQAERNGKIPSFKYIMRDSGTARPVVDTGKIENKMFSDEQGLRLSDSDTLFFKITS